MSQTAPGTNDLIKFFRLTLNLFVTQCHGDAINRNNELYVLKYLGGGREVTATKVDLIKVSLEID